MAMRYGYFDSEITGVDSEGMPIFDRAETSELFRLLFAKLLTNGVLALPGDCFQVVAGSSGLTVKIRPYDVNALVDECVLICGACRHIHSGVIRKGGYAVDAQRLSKLLHLLAAQADRKSTRLNSSHWS